jgi:phage gp36-like protein
MAYASSADFIIKFGETEWLQLTDRDVDETSDAGVGADALNDASGVVDGYLRSIYVIPLSVVDPVIKQITLDLARWILSGNQASERVLDGYKEANKRLDDIAKQRLVLTSMKISEVVNTDGTTASSSGIAYTTPEIGYTRMPEPYL